MINFFLSKFIFKWHCGMNIVFLKTFFFFFRILSIFNTHTGREGEGILKKLTVVYIQKCLTLEYTTQTLNLFNSHSFFNVGKKKIWQPYYELLNIYFELNSLFSFIPSSCIFEQNEYIYIYTHTLLMRGVSCFVFYFWHTKISSYKFWNNIPFSLMFFPTKKQKRLK